MNGSSGENIADEMNGTADGATNGGPGSGHVVGPTDPEVIIRFIKKVKTMPILYNQDDENFRNVSMKAQAWKEIANELNLDVAWCSKKWVSLRDYFVKRKKLLRQGKPARPWIYYSELSFLNMIYGEDYIDMDNMGGDGGSDSMETEYKYGMFYHMDSLVDFEQPPSRSVDANKIQQLHEAALQSSNISFRELNQEEGEYPESFRFEDALKVELTLDEESDVATPSPPPSRTTNGSSHHHHHNNNNNNSYSLLSHSYPNGTTSKRLSTEKSQRSKQPPPCLTNSSGKVMPRGKSSGNKGSQSQRETNGTSSVVISGVAPPTKKHKFNFESPSVQQQQQQHLYKVSSDNSSSSTYAGDDNPMASYNAYKNDSSDGEGPEYLRNGGTGCSIHNDPHDLFCLSVAGHLRQMTRDKALRLQIQIMELLYKAEFP